MSDGTGGGTPRMRRADLFLQTYDSVVERLEKLFGANSRVAGKQQVTVLAVSNLDNAEAELQAKSEKLSLPYVAVAPMSVEPDTGSYNASVLRKFGHRSTISSDRSTWTFLSLVPIVVTYQVLMVTDDYPTMLRMTDRWMSNELWGTILVHEDYRIHVQIIVDKALQVPPRAASAGGADQFRQTTTMRVKTYSGYILQIPSIAAVDLAVGVTQRDIHRLDEQGLVDDLVLERVIVAPSHLPVT